MLPPIALFLAAAVIFVPLFKRFGLGAVLGYLAAGLVIGPGGLGLVGDVQEVLHVSELGVVMLLFIIGLELQPRRLWRLRAQVLGTGGLQVLLTTLVLGGIAYYLGLNPVTALVVGFGLAMSSTAMVLQMLNERKEMPQPHGRSAFSILLFQDISIIPFLALVPLLAVHPTTGASGGWQPIAIALAAIGLIVVGGRYALRPFFRIIAAAELPEVFTAAALLIVVGAALLMESVGLSMSLGAFLAGVLLAGSEYRHELQAEIEPFKGLLLGLFFIAVGMSADTALVLREPFLVAELAIGLLVIKAVILFVVGKIVGLRTDYAKRLAILAAQGGEFAFVLFGVANTAGILEAEIQGLLVLAVTVSMILTPPLYALIGRVRPEADQPPYDEIVVPETPVVIAGFGPFGQIIGRVLRLRQIPYTVLERDWQQVDFVRQFGNPVFYSDATRLEVLRAAHVHQAKLFIVSVAEPESASLRIAETVRRHFPKVRVFAVARTREHAMQLMDLGVHKVIRRAYFSSLEMTRWTLEELGEDRETAKDVVNRFRRFDQKNLLQQQAIHHDETKMVQSARDAARDLERLFELDSESSKKEASTRKKKKQSAEAEHDSDHRNSI